MLSRPFEQIEANQAWVCNMTFIQTRSGWLYLAAVLNLHSRKIMAKAMRSPMPPGSVCAAFRVAIV